MESHPHIWPLIYKHLSTFLELKWSGTLHDFSRACRHLSIFRTKVEWNTSRFFGEDDYFWGENGHLSTFLELKWSGTLHVLHVTRFWWRVIRCAFSPPLPASLFLHHPLPPAWLSACSFHTQWMDIYRWTCGLMLLIIIIKEWSKVCCLIVRLTNIFEK